MAKKFSLSENMVNSVAKNVGKAKIIDAKDSFKFDYIDIDKIIVNSKNFYPIVEINSLAEDISINGLNHNLVVRPVSEEVYEIISGERRYTALKTLVDRGESKYKIVPCKVINLNDIDAEIVLIQANAQTRDLTDADKLKQVERLTELYKKKKEKGEKITDIRGLVSKDIGLSTGQVAKYTSVSNNLIPQLRSALDEGNLTISNATIFAGLNEEGQKLILDMINRKVDISKQEATEIKKQLKEVEEEKNRLLEMQEQEVTEIEDIVTQRLEEIKNKFELIKLEKEKLQTENSKLKEKLNVNDTLSRDESLRLSINYELKLRLNNAKDEISKVSGLISNNEVIEEDTLKLVKDFEKELKVLKNKILKHSN